MNVPNVLTARASTNLRQSLRDTATMAKRQVVTMTDDLDPTQPADVTIEFGLDNVSYEIDLSTGNADGLGSMLAPYIGAARRTGGRRTTAPQNRAGSGRSSNPGAVRAWAASKGIEINARGRVPADVQEKYDAAH